MVANNCGYSIFITNTFLAVGHFDFNKVEEVEDLSQLWSSQTVDFSDLAVNARTQNTDSNYLLYLHRFKIKLLIRLFSLQSGIQILTGNSAMSVYLVFRHGYTKLEAKASANIYRHLLCTPVSIVFLECKSEIFDVNTH